MCVPILLDRAHDDMVLNCMAKDTRLYLRCSLEQKERIAKAANISSDGDVSKMVLDAVMRRVQRIERQDARKPVGEAE